MFTAEQSLIDLMWRRLGGVLNAQDLQIDRAAELVMAHLMSGALVAEL